MHRLLSVLLLLGLSCCLQNVWAQYDGNSPFCHQRGGLLINEISSGPTTGQNNKEYVELVVTGSSTDPLAPVDLSGWILDDNNVAASGHGNAAGHFVLGDCYQAVPPGSILVVYNPTDRNPDIPADDPMDADQDGVYIIPADNACIQVCNSNPTTSDADYCPCADPDAPFTAWQIGMRNGGDVFQVRDDCETVVQAISWGNLQLTDDVRNSPTFFRISGDNQSASVIRFTNFVSNDWNDPVNYDNPSTDTGQTPGAPNNAANDDFIQQLRTGGFNECGGMIADCKVADAGDLVAPAGSNTPITLCQGEDLGAFVANYDEADEILPQADGLNFEYAFLLTEDDAPDYPLLSFNTDGDFDFSNLQEGNYRLWGYSYIQTNGSVTVTDFLTNSVSSIQDIQTFLACGYDGDLDSLDRNGQIVEVQVVTAPTAIAPTNPLTVCGNLPTGMFNLTNYDLLISDTTGIPVLWYSDAAATQAITTPTAFTSAPTTVFARLEQGICISDIVPVQLRIGGELDLRIQIDQDFGCNSPLAAISLNIPNTNNFDIDWNFNEWDGQTTLSGLVPETYSVTVTDGNGCIDSTAIRLSSNIGITAEFLARATSCPGVADGSIELFQVLGGSPPFEFSINGSDFESSTTWEATDLLAGKYTITIRDNTGCESAQSVTVSDAPALGFDLGPDLELEQGDSVFLSPVADFMVSGLEANPIEGILVGLDGTLLVKPDQTTTYQFTAISTDGCRVSDELTITVTIPPVPIPMVFIPDAFSPNGDGVNDTFTVYGDGLVVNVKSMRIFDRWGSLLYSAENLSPNEEGQGWQGQGLGQSLVTGLYIYFVEVEYEDGHTEIFKGEVNVLR